MTTEEVIAKLKEDYSIRASRKRRDFPVQDEIEDEIEDLEQSYITSVVIPELKARAQELLGFLECEVTLGVKSDCNGTVTVTDEYVSSVSSEYQPSGKIGTVDDEYETILINRDNIQESSGKRLRVTFPDGTVFYETISKDTFLKTLMKIGLSRIPDVGIQIMKYNLVDTSQRLDKGYPWQQKVDDYWVYVYMSNPRKVGALLDISDHFNLNLKIEAVNEGRDA